ncbi:hypothetical protein Tco_0448703 [Tanacetum coccineum]
MEAVQDISGCGDNQKVKYYVGSLTDRELTWWNSEVRTRGHEAAVGMIWEDFKALMKEEYCPSNNRNKKFHIQTSIAVTKVIKKEFEKLGFLEIDEDLFTYDTQLGMIFNEFNRLSRINDDLFTYEIEVPKPTPCVEQRTGDPTHNDLGEYEWKMSYEECEKIYAEALILINKRLVRLIEVTVEQWLDLKYRNHKTLDKNVKKGVIGTWLIRSYKLQFEEYLEIKRQRETYAREVYWIRGDDEVILSNEKVSNLKDENNHDEHEIAKIFRIETNLFDFETPTCKAFKEFNYLFQINPDVLTKDIIRFKTYEEYKDDWIYEWNEDVPWVLERPWTDNGVWEEPTPWYEALEDGKLKDEALFNKAIMEGIIDEGEESYNETWRRWDDCENTTHDPEEREYEEEQEDKE